MRVFIGPYKGWFGPYQLVDKLRKVGLRESWCEWLEEKIPAAPFEWLYERRKRRVEVRIDDYDVWNADHTLALIIVPLLEKLAEGKNGLPYVDDEDAPHVKCDILDSEERDNDLEFMEAKWRYVLGEMLWAMRQSIEEDTSASHVPYGPDEDFEPSYFKDSNGAPVLFFYGKTREEAIMRQREVGRFDLNKHKAYQDRINNGHRLFGKYFRSLWT